MNEDNWTTQWSTDQVKTILIEQMEYFQQYELGITREALPKLLNLKNTPHVVIISGLRRVGKSTLLAQLSKQLGSDSFYYLNFEDERFINFRSQDFNQLFQFLVELFGVRHFFLVDEVQNIHGWEHFVRRFMDQGYKFFITGSNAALLTKEMGTKLTGRYVSVELFPFSFNEFLIMRGGKIPNLEKLTSVNQAQLKKALMDYLNTGGIPEALKYPDLPILKYLFNDVLYRDIAARYRIEAVTALRELAFFIFSNPAGLISYNKIKNRLKLGSLNTVKSFVEHLENAWLLFVINVFDYSVKRQQIAPKKVFLIDVGLSNEIGFHFSPDTGKLLENLVFLYLRKKSQNIFYGITSEGYELDFYLPDDKQIVQVSQSLINPNTRTRELRAIESSIKEFDVKKALLLADSDEPSFQIQGVPVEIKSVVKWLITN